jgi:hypothetical protein
MKRFMNYTKEAFFYFYQETKVMSHNILSAYISERFQTKVEGEDKCLTLLPLPVDDNKVITNHPGYIIFYDGNVKCQSQVTCTKTQSSKRIKNSFVNVIQKFQKVVQMCVLPYIQAGHGTQP